MLSINVIWILYIFLLLLTVIFTIYRLTEFSFFVEYAFYFESFLSVFQCGQHCSTSERAHTLKRNYNDPGEVSFCWSISQEGCYGKKIWSNCRRMCSVLPGKLSDCVAVFKSNEYLQWPTDSWLMDCITFLLMEANASENLKGFL